jgi:transposase InsO family protein
VQDAVDATGMTGVPVEDRTKLLSDNGPGYVSRAFRDYLRLVGIRHILGFPRSWPNFVGSRTGGALPPAEVS